MKAYGKDILRSIAKGRRRFFAIMLITVLGVTMFSGLRAACGDLRLSADRFYDAQDLHDIEVMSTLGMTDKDISALASLDGVKDCQGVFELDTDLSDGKGGKVSIAAPADVKEEYKAMLIRASIDAFG